jgi:hypothetical protein
MRGAFLMRCEPGHVILRTLAELVQQTLQMPPREAAGEGAAAFHGSAIQHGGSQCGKKEFFTFVCEICQKVLAACELSEPLESIKLLGLSSHADPGRQQRSKTLLDAGKARERMKTFVDSTAADASVIVIPFQTS